MNIFITGVSAGLGLGLALAAQKAGHSVYGCSRRPSSLSLQGHWSCDIAQMQREDWEAIFKQIPALDMAIFNAAQLGEIKKLKDTSIEELQDLMNVNVWANKVCCDAILSHFPKLAQVVFISSGASINGHAGWGGYSLSKATLNMLAKLYASEVSDTHFCALAPGLIDTDMQSYLCEKVDAKLFPSLERLKNCRNTDQMPTPHIAGKTIWEALGKCRQQPSGSYLDIRNL
jgi:benzil reductase ((S)-benzoin forming)